MSESIHSFDVEFARPENSRMGENEGDNDDEIRNASIQERLGGAEAEPVAEK